MGIQRHEIRVKYGGKLDVIMGLGYIIKLFDADEGIWTYTIGNEVYQSSESPPLKDDKDNTRSKIYDVIKDFVKSSPASLEFKVKVEALGSKKMVQIVK